MQLFLKGLVIGFGKMLPGVSGGMIAMMFHVYEEGVFSLVHFFENPRKHFLFLFPIGLGIFLSMIYSSKLILWLLEFYYLPTMLLFIGLITGGLPSIASSFSKNSKTFCCFLFSLFFLLSFSFLPTFSMITGTKGSFFLILVGFIEAITMIIPGISGTAILMIFGYYEVIISSLGRLTSVSAFFLELPILLPFMIGLLSGLFSCLKFVDSFFQSFHDEMYACVLGFASSSIFLLFQKTLQFNYSFITIVTSLCFLILGVFFSFYFSKKEE